MPFNSDKQRKAFFAKQGSSRSDVSPGRISKVKPLPDSLVNPYFIPKDAKYVVTKSTGIRAYTGKVDFYKSKRMASADSKRTNRPVFRIPQKGRLASYSRGRWVTARRKSKTGKHRDFLETKWVEGFKR